MSAQGADVGAPWPTAAAGEVVGPSGGRCYTAEMAGAILGTTGRNVRNWVHQRDRFPELVEEKEDSGKRRYFLTAEGVEAVARRLGRWPPETPLAGRPVSPDAATWQELTLQQGRDLELARKARFDAESLLASERQTSWRLRAQIRQLETQLRDLSIAAEALAKVSRQMFASPSKEDGD